VSSDLPEKQYPFTRITRRYVEQTYPMQDYESQGNPPCPWLRAVAVSLCLWAVLIFGVMWLVGTI